MLCDALIIRKRTHELRHHDAEKSRQETEKAKMLEKVTRENHQKSNIFYKKIIVKEEGGIRFLTVLSYIGSSRALWAKVGERSAATLMYSRSRDGRPVSLSCSRYVSGPCW